MSRLGPLRYIAAPCLMATGFDFCEPEAPIGGDMPTVSAVDTVRPVLVDGFCLGRRDRADVGLVVRRGFLCHLVPSYQQRLHA